MTKKEFYENLKEKTSFFFNFLMLLSLIGSGIFFIYSKIFNSDELRVVYEVIFVPQKDYNVLLYDSDLNKDSVKFENCHILTKISLQNNKNHIVRNVEISLKDYFSDGSGIPKGFYLKDYENLNYFEGQKVIEIDAIKPNEFYQINIYSESTGIYYNNIISSDGGISRAREVKNIIVENDFDEWVTMFVISNVSIQILVFIFTIIGIYITISKSIRYILN